MRHVGHLKILLAVSVAALAASLAGAGSSGGAVATAQSNPIVVENQQPGTTAWQATKVGTDAVGHIKGYASAVSVDKGDNITFFVSVNPVQTYSIQVFRMGWYQGLGGRLLAQAGPLQGVQQPACPPNSTTGLIACNWAPSYTLTTQTSWTSGIYLALLTNAQGYQNYIEFVVRDDSRVADLLYQQPVNTYEAYNDWPDDSSTGKSLYEFDSYGANTVAGTPRAVKVSFDRPYADNGTGAAGQSFLTWEFDFVRWAERSGYDISYSTDVDTDQAGNRLLGYKGFLSVGHDEYWSKAMFDAAQNARDAGVNLGFFGANAVYWQVRYEPSASGVPDRTIVCYKDDSIDPVSDRSLVTENWRYWPEPFRPEQTLIGVQFTNQIKNNADVPYVVQNSSNWVYAGTGFTDGATVPGIVGYEADRSSSDFDLPTSVAGTYTLLSHSPFTSYDTNKPDYSNSSVYQAPSGAWVFAAGTFGWSWALDDYGGRGLVDPRIQQTTANVLNRFTGTTAATPDFSLSASPSTDTITQGTSADYTVTITPKNGFGDQVALSVSGLPAGASATFNPNPATSTSMLNVSTTASTPAGSYPLTVTGTDAPLSHSTGVTLVVNAAPSADFSLSASPSTQTVTQGASAGYTVTITALNGFTDAVTMSVTGLPAGANATFSPNPATSSSTLNVSTSAATPAGSYPLAVTGTDAPLSHSTGVTLVVNAAPKPSFTLSASPSSQTISRGGTAQYTVTVNPAGGFTGNVTLKVSGLPPGATASFSPNPTSSTATLSVTASSTRKSDTRTITITGTSGGLSASTRVTLQVQR